MATISNKQSSTPEGQGRVALDIKEAAYELSISTKSVRRLIDRGLIKPVRALRKLIIPRAEIQRFLAENVLDLD